MFERIFSGDELKNIQGIRTTHTIKIDIQEDDNTSLDKFMDFLVDLLGESIVKQIGKQDEE